ncbi:MAG: hypothetical protein L0170_11610 [Acidobacteria bacterium]|nr:hypothetical protein [Acidobacteriota bacterium]
MKRLSLYLVQFDGERWYVEAPGVLFAITAWRDFYAISHVCKKPDEPDSVALVARCPVIRFEEPSEEPRQDEE